MTLSIFIIGNGKRSETYKYMLRDRFQFVDHFEYVDSIEQINDTHKRAFWYLVLHEGEMLDARLTLAILKTIKLNGDGVTTVFNLFKKTIDKVSICPRLFRSDVLLDCSCLLPKAMLTTVACNLLDGWMFDV